MKKIIKTMLILTILIICLVILTGCGSKQAMSTSTYDSDDIEASVSLTYPDSEDYKFSTNSDDFRTTANEAILLGPDFKIAIQIRDLSFHFDKDFNNYKGKYISEEGGKEITVADLNGFVWYYAPYKAAVVVLPIELNPEYALELYIYTEKDSEDEVMEVFNSDAVQDILKTVKITEK